MNPAYLEELRSKKSDTISSVVKEHTGAIYGGALGLGFSEDAAQELVQATFVTFLETVGRFEGRSTVRTYLFGILYRKAHEAWRARKKEQANDPAEAIFEKRFNEKGRWTKPPKGPEDSLLAQETLRLIDECAEGLTMKQRTAFYLREVEMLSTDEICNALDVTGTHLGVLLFRARNKLRECLEARWVSS